MFFAHDHNKIKNENDREIDTSRLDTTLFLITQPRTQGAFPLKSPAPEVSLLRSPNRI